MLLLLLIAATTANPNATAPATTKSTAIAATADAAAVAAAAAAAAASGAASVTSARQKRPRHTRAIYIVVCATCAAMSYHETLCILVSSTDDRRQNLRKHPHDYYYCRHPADHHRCPAGTCRDHHLRQHRNARMITISLGTAIIPHTQGRVSFVRNSLQQARPIGTATIIIIIIIIITEPAFPGGIRRVCKSSDTLSIPLIPLFLSSLSLSRSLSLSLSPSPSPSRSLSLSLTRVAGPSPTSFCVAQDRRQHN